MKVESGFMIGRILSIEVFFLILVKDVELVFIVLCINRVIVEIRVLFLFG